MTTTDAESLSAAAAALGASALELAERDFPFWCFFFLPFFDGFELRLDFFDDLMDESNCVCCSSFGSMLITTAAAFLEVSTFSFA